jgi:hypothetical protein
MGNYAGETQVEGHFAVFEWHKGIGIALRGIIFSADLSLPEYRNRSVPSQNSCPRRKITNGAFLHHHWTIHPRLLEWLAHPEFRALLLLVLIMLLTGTFFYSKFEGWNLSDSLYFSVATLAMVGYGDLAPIKAIGQILKCPMR